MKYERNQYSEGFSVCSLIIGALFLWWGLNHFYTNRIFDPSWWIWNWWGIILLVIGLSIIGGQFANLFNRSKLRKVVKQEFLQNPNASVDEISKNTGISVKDVRAIILDLKASGELRGRFSSSTGQMKYTEVQQKGMPQSIPNQSSTKQTPSEEPKTNYCPNCGTPITKEDAAYCQYCGARLHE
ncbi:MAG: hypothetical protein BAJALOKI3v1_70093 [Promethearchaeota archaeon]|jgi:hypothetical protein|nr:MAG: hypothetical protein BAJALOKI3v1_70093 [Candidatus Lokiarchaeota archaeon]